MSHVRRIYTSKSHVLVFLRQCLLVHKLCILQTKVQWNQDSSQQIQVQIYSVTYSERPVTNLTLLSWILSESPQSEGFCVCSFKTYLQNVLRKSPFTCSHNGFLIISANRGSSEAWWFEGTRRSNFPSLSKNVSLSSPRGIECLKPHFYRIILLPSVLSLWKMHPLLLG